MAQSTKPSGLTLTRKNNKFTASWKIPKGGYDDGQLAQYAIGSGGWKKLTDSKTATKKAFTVKLSDYYPTNGKKEKVKEVKVRVCGNSEGATTTVSDWTTKTFKIEPPKNPSLSTATGEYVTVFSWKVRDNDNDAYWFSKVEWESVLLRDSSETQGKNVSFTKGYVKNTKLSGTSTKSDYSKTITEDGATIADGHSYTRWFRIKAFGPAGESDWIYKKHTYALPIVSTIDKTKTKVTKSKDELNYKCNVYFNTSISAKYPAEKVEVKYLMTIPEIDLSCPSGASWTTAATPVINKKINDKEKYSSNSYDNSGGTTFYIGDTLNPDYCLFLRVDVTHDTKTIPGRPYLVKINDIPGVLSSPINLDVEASSNHTASITVENQSQVPDSKVLIVYDDKRIGKIQYVGILDHNSSSTIIKYPETDSTPKFGAMAFVGEIKEGSGGYWPTEDTAVTEGKPYYYSSTTIFDEGLYDDLITSFPYTSQTALEYEINYDIDTNSNVTLNINLGNGSRISHINFVKGTSATKTTTIYYNGQEYTISASYNGNKSIYGLKADREIEEGLQNINLYIDVSYNTTNASKINASTIYKLIANPSGNPKGQGWFETYSIPIYNIDPVMVSPIVWDGGEIITAPQNITAERYDISGTIRVTWDWAWDEANAVELSWADHIDAWESTDEPSTYIVTKLYSSAWNISGLETGKKWYVRARFISGLGDGASYGVYSDIYTVDLTSAPLIPSITLNPSTITETGETTATWTYSSTDGTLQDSAELVEVTVNDEGQNVYTPLQNAQIRTEQSYTISAVDQGWHYGESHSIAVKVSSESGISSDDYSVPDTVTIAEPATCMISSTSLEPYTSYTTDEEGQVVSETVNALRDMPLTVKVISGYEISSDAEVVSGKTYYTRSDTTDYSYEEIEEPQGNPKEQEWYELDDNVYVLTNDETVIDQKAYYSRNGEPNYVYSVVSDPSGDPSTSDYYEEVLVDESSIITLVISRAMSYDIDRPDETHYGVFEGETITLLTTNEYGVFTVTLNDLIGNLDDGARYLIEATVQDGLGQTEHDDVEFEVHWTHQAVAPTVSVSIDDEETIAILTPIAPAEQDDILYYDTKSLFPSTGTFGKIYISKNDGKLYRWDGSDYAENTDVCDIYRLSVDKPELIYEGAVFGTTYVDPYPTIGEYGGHRFVTRTINGDYITGDSIKGDFAWTDTRKDQGDIFNTHSNIIDFDGGRAFVLYEVDMSSSWSKDFKETQYLGGHTQGDWNRGVRRTGSINVIAVSDYDQDMIQTMRRLAAYPGICHVRSKDGSSYAADVQVNESYEYTKTPRFNKYDLSITRIDSEGFDVVTYQDWLDSHEQES